MAVATVPTISELVRGRLDSGYNTSELQELTSSPELPNEARVQRQQFELLADGRVSSYPREPEKIRGYAAALGVDERTVVLAFARQLGLHVEDNQSPLASMLPRDAERLTMPQAIAIADLVRVFTMPSTDGEGIPGLDLHGAPAEEMREIMQLWTELKTRASAAAPRVAATLDTLAGVVERAIQDAKR